jgi:hypothetical protein
MLMFASAAAAQDPANDRVISGNANLSLISKEARSKVRDESLRKILTDAKVSVIVIMKHETPTTQYSIIYALGRRTKFEPKKEISEADYRVLMALAEKYNLD